MPEIIESKYGEDGAEVFLRVELPIDPYGAAHFASEDDSEESRNALQELVEHWPALWPKMLDLLVSRISDCGLDINLASKRFVASVGAMEDDVYMSEESDVFVSLCFEEVPEWHFFIRGDAIAHFQPVY